MEFSHILTTYASNYLNGLTFGFDHPNKKYDFLSQFCSERSGYALHQVSIKRDLVGSQIKLSLELEEKDSHFSINKENFKEDLLRCIEYNLENLGYEPVINYDDNSVSFGIYRRF
jgi:hypothetical protein